MSATWVRIISWSLPKVTVPPSARNKSDHSKLALPNACPSALDGVFALAVTKDNTPLPFVCNTCPELPSAVGKLNATLLDVRINLEPSEWTLSAASEN